MSSGFDRGNQPDPYIFSLSKKDIKGFKIRIDKLYELQKQIDVMVLELENYRQQVLEEGMQRNRQPHSHFYGS